MISYALRRNCNNIILLYPNTTKELNTPTLFQIPSAMLPERLNIHIQNIDIKFDDLNEADKLLIDRIKQLDPIFV
jgi:5-methylcytosine-specific restriction enzyme subunit McrC